MEGDFGPLLFSFMSLSELVMSLKILRGNLAFALTTAIEANFASVIFISTRELEESLQQRVNQACINEGLDPKNLTQSMKAHDVMFRAVHYNHTSMEIDIALSIQAILKATKYKQDILVVEQPSLADYLKGVDSPLGLALPTKAESVIHSALVEAFQLTKGTVSQFDIERENSIDSAAKANIMLEKVLITYPDLRSPFSRSVCWNREAGNAWSCKDHPRVMGAALDVLSKFPAVELDANSPLHTIGILNTHQGALVVNPGDWIVEVLKDTFVVLNDETYRELFL